jgi:hypothetical protein
VFTPATSGVLRADVSSPNNVFPAIEVEAAGGPEVLETEPNDGINVAAGRVQAGVTYFVRVRAKDDAPAEYSVDLLLADRLPGDANGDGRVGLDDLNAVRNNFGGVGLGDVNGDGVVNLDDLNDVRNNFGEQVTDPHPADTVAEQENNDTQASANSFALPAGAKVDLVGTSENKDDKDFFTFTAPVDGTLHVEVRAANGNFAAVEVESDASVDVLETEPNNGVNRASGTVQAGQRYFIRARSTEDVPAAYVIELRIEPNASVSSTVDAGRSDPSAIESVPGIALFAERNEDDAAAVDHIVTSDSTPRFFGERHTEDVPPNPSELRRGLRRTRENNVPRATDVAVRQIREFRPGDFWDEIGR